MKNLHANGLLESLDFEPPDTCEPCLIGKMTKTPFSGTMERASDLMEHKSETFQQFKEFQSEVENHRNKKIKFLRSDHGDEYLSYEFGLHLKQYGIVSQLMPPGTPQCNGVSERGNRTLLDMVHSRCLLPIYHYHFGIMH